MRISLFLLIITVVVSCVKGINDDDGYFLQKRHRLLEEVADHYTPPSLNIGDPEKYCWPKVVARFEIYGTNDSLANYYLETLRDRSPFHFTLVGMARIMSRYTESDFIRQNKKVLLKGVFDRTDSFNPWTAEGTENHINMSRTSGYLFAEHALDYPNDFPDARERLSMMKEWIRWWSKQIFQTGTGEWNSSIYMTYNIIGWLNLYDYALDNEVKEMARAVLDAYAVEMALHNSWGETGGSEMRGVGALLNGRSASTYLNWLWFSEKDIPWNGFSGSEYIQSVHAATSSYRPDPVIRQLAREKSAIPAYYLGSKPSYNFEEASFIKQTFWVDRDFTLGNSISRYGGFTGASFQMVPWKLIIRDSIPLVISGNGAFFEDRSGKTRSPFTQTVQNKNVLIQLTKVPLQASAIAELVDSIADRWNTESLNDLKKRYPDETYKMSHILVNTPKKRLYDNKSFISLPHNEHYQKHANGYVFSYGDVLVHIFSLNPERDVLHIASNRTIIETSADHNNLCGFIIEVLNDSSLSKGNDIVISRKGNQVAYKSMAGDVIEMEFMENGDYIEPMVDWGYGPTQPVLYSTSPPFIQPSWKQVPFGGRVPTFWVNNKLVDTSIKWPVYIGTGVNWDKGIISIDNRAGSYRIEYNGVTPLFSK